ncbi:MAG: FliI/YscN family ATPase [Rhodospirillales bacterium]|nr:FliI/YscN family ATPase [Rhodospirillales bacterium]
MNAFPQLHALTARLQASADALGTIEPAIVMGRVVAVRGLAVEVAGLGGLAGIGARVMLQPRNAPPVPAELVGFAPGRAIAMPFAATAGLAPGDAVRTGLRPRPAALFPCEAWFGRVLDPLGNPVDQRGPLPRGLRAAALDAAPPAAATRARLGPRLALGVAALDLFATCREGQRLGLFAGPGVGKSTLLGMLARDAGADVVVAGLVGERGREVRSFLEDDLGAGLARSIVVIATSDAPPLARRDAARAAMAIAEHFRDQGAKVLLLLDSVTRFCAALREIGLAAGEPPAARGYPPRVFAELPRLLERAGPGREGQGSITLFATVLVDGDDMTEPVADAVRGILDGHVVLDRRIAESGRYPAVDILRSLSRTVPGCLEPHEARAAAAARAALAQAADLADLVRLGAYQRGADPAADAALAAAPAIEAMLRQAPGEPRDAASGFAQLAAILTAPGG